MFSKTALALALSLACMATLENPSRADDRAVHLSVVGAYGRSIVPEMKFSAKDVGFPSTVYKLLQKELKHARVAYSVQPKTKYITMIDGDREELKSGYGWCYSVNGQQPDAGMSSEWIPDEVSNIKIYYGQYVATQDGGGTCVADARKQ